MGPFSNTSSDEVAPRVFDAQLPDVGWPALGRDFQARSEERKQHECQDITETIRVVQCRVGVREGEILAVTSGVRAGDF